MKKLFILFTLCLLLVGCGKKGEKEKTIIAEYARNYYANYMTAPNLDVAEVTIEMLENANNQMNSGYDLSKLAKCTKESLVQLYIKKGTREIEKYEYQLNCSK